MEISEQTERGQSCLIHCHNTGFLQGPVCFSEYQGLTKNRKPTSQALFFPLQSLNYGAPLYWDHCWLLEQHHPGVLLSSPEAANGAPGIQMLYQSSWYWWLPNKPRNKEREIFWQLSKLQKEIIESKPGVSLHVFIPLAGLCKYGDDMEIMHHLGPEQDKSTKCISKTHFKMMMKFTFILVVVVKGCQFW